VSQPRFERSTSRINPGELPLREFLLTYWHTNNSFTQRAILVSSRLNHVAHRTWFMKHSLPTKERTSKHDSLLPHATDYPVFACGLISKRWLYGFKKGKTSHDYDLWIGRHVEGSDLI
jgi:hypothetical protein